MCFNDNKDIYHFSEFQFDFQVFNLKNNFSYCIQNYDHLIFTFDRVELSFPLLSDTNTIKTAIRQIQPVNIKFFINDNFIFKLIPIYFSLFSIELRFLYNECCTKNINCNGELHDRDSCIEKKCFLFLPVQNFGFSFDYGRFFGNLFLSLSLEFSFIFKIFFDFLFDFLEEKENLLEFQIDNIKKDIFSKIGYKKINFKFSFNIKMFKNKKFPFVCNSFYFGIPFLEYLNFGFFDNCRKNFVYPLGTCVFNKFNLRFFSYIIKKIKNIEISYFFGFNFAQLNEFICCMCDFSDNYNSFKKRRFHQSYNIHFEAVGFRFSNSDINTLQRGINFDISIFSISIFNKLIGLKEVKYCYYDIHDSLKREHKYYRELIYHDIFKLKNFSENLTKIKETFIYWKQKEFLNIKAFMTLFDLFIFSFSVVFYNKLTNNIYIDLKLCFHTRLSNFRFVFVVTPGITYR